MFDRAELEEAFTRYQQRGTDAAASHDWDAWADQFTEDAIYVEHLYGMFQGREAIRTWITRTMTTFPGVQMPIFPVNWSVFDLERGWIVCEIANRMADPGDGSIHEAANLTVLHYAGNDQWSREEDVYNPSSFVSMITGWCRRAEELGTITDDARRWMRAVQGRS